MSLYSSILIYLICDLFPGCFLYDGIFVGFQHEFARVAHIADFGRVGNKRRVGFGTIYATLASVGGGVDVFRRLPLGTIVLKTAVGEHFLVEIAANRQSCAAALTEFAGAEVNAAIFAAYPSTAHQMRCYAHKPRVAMVVARTGFATEVGIL